MAATKANDVTKMMQEMMGSFPVDTKAIQDAFKTQATLSEKMSKVALEAAEKSTEISSKWTKETLAKLAAVTAVKDEPADYGKAVTDFASAQAEMTSEALAAFAEVAKKVQMETVELMLAAGKDISEDATAAVKKATADVTAAAKKATTVAK
ncbi:MULTISPECIES: phasin, PhaP [unclassified Meridianimarinicoccus]|uniref:phasin, PhaP n=1 Tax=unclassified Meridianimarinicoccus TaxID=2923344 RepID=UPI0018663373|nr:phasin, PhaP [Fluviibacterium sp. MJW13]